MDKAAIADPSSPVISVWGSGWHGLEALAQPHAVLLGLSLVGLTSLLGALYVLQYVDNGGVRKRMHESITRLSIPFVAVFVVWLAMLILGNGYAVDAVGNVTVQQYKYLDNLLEMPAVLAMLVVGVGLIVWGLVQGAQIESHRGFWPAAGGTVLVVMAVFFLAGFNNTAYYPSTADLQSSLTIRNSSSSYFTLQVMSWVSLLIPFVVAYIAYAWHAMDRKKISLEEIEGPGNKY